MQHYTIETETLTSTENISILENSNPGTVGNRYSFDPVIRNSDIRHSLFQVG